MPTWITRAQLAAASDPSLADLIRTEGTQSHDAVKDRARDALADDPTVAAAAAALAQSTAGLVRTDSSPDTGMVAENGVPIWVDWENHVDPTLGVVMPTLMTRIALGVPIIADADPSSLVPSGVEFLWVDRGSGRLYLMEGEA